MKKKKENIIIPKKALAGIASAVAIIAVLLSKDKSPEVFLFIIGIVVGFFITRGFFKK